MSRFNFFGTEMYYTTTAKGLPVLANDSLKEREEILNNLYSLLKEVSLDRFMPAECKSYVQLTAECKSYAQLK